MKTLQQPQILILSVLLISLFLAACSVEQKQGSVPTTIPDEAEIPETILDEIDQFPEQIIESSGSSQTLMKLKKRPLTSKQLFSGTLDAHNRIRAKHSLPPLKWSDKLAAYSQQWADHLGKGSRCTMRHRGGTPPYGENLYLSSAVIWTEDDREVARERNRVTIRDVVKVWTDEERWYDYNRNSCQPGQRCGHYTQVVWRDTTEVGCAMKLCADKSQSWVCSYNPPGNYTDVRPY
jgi:pathogenesis-related protein 1